jgi:hypothetical protein
MKGEFRKGDVIVQIGGNLVYVICGAYQTTIWYGVKCLRNGQVITSEVYRNAIDSNYVKVDFCKNVFDDVRVYLKLADIEEALSK